MSIKSKIAALAGLAAILDSKPEVSIKGRSTQSQGIKMPPKDWKKRQIRKKMQKQSRKINRKK